MNSSGSLLFQVLLYLHIAGGMTGLITGLFNVTGKKGSRAHKKTGLIYVAGMFAATLCGIVLAFMKDNNFLFLIGIFSFYLAFTGYRSLKNKSENPTLVKWIDVWVAVITCIFSIWMVISALIYLNPFRLHFNPVQFIFGVAGLVFSVGDLLWFFGKRKFKFGKFQWMFTHIGRMVGSYISAVTAFLVVNINFLPPLLIWLGPSVLGSCVIAYNIRKYRLKLRV
ncbi:MAG: hypothetical protein KDC13_02305 [Bacteroidetes bacterium]|nr:hypothetical protein [Bacteroidota bacterium]